MFSVLLIDIHKCEFNLGEHSKVMWDMRRFFVVWDNPKHCRTPSFLSVPKRQWGCQPQTTLINFQNAPSGAPQLLLSSLDGHEHTPDVGSCH